MPGLKHAYRIILLLACISGLIALQNPVPAQIADTIVWGQTLKKEQYKSIIQHASSSPAEKMDALDSLASFCLYEGDTLQAYHYKIQKAILLSIYGNSFTPYYTAKKILQDLSFAPASPARDSLLRRSLLLSAITAQKSSFWEESLGLCSDFIQTYPDMTPVEAAQIYSTIGSDNMFIGNIALSRRYHNKAIDIVQDEDIPVYIKTKVYNALSGYFFLIEQYDSSLYIQQKVEQLPQSDMLPIQICYLYNNISLIHSTIGNYKISFDYQQKALQAASRLQEPNHLQATLLRNLALSYWGEGDTARAKENYEKALSYALQTGNKENLWLIYLELGELCQETGDISRGYQYLVEGYIIKDQLNSIQNQQRSFLLNRDLELLKSKKEQEILQQNLELERLSNEKRLILIIVFASLLIIFLTASLWMIFQMLKSRKKDQELAQNLSLDYQASQEELQKKEKDLAAATLFAAQKDESLKNLKKQCTELLKQDMNAQQQAIVREMLQTINLCHYGSSWEEFRIRFDMAYPDFYKNLAETGVELTKSERYLAALLAININTKEISSMTQKSPRSVETYIYRLRKKLGIPTETKTHDYFHAFLGKEDIR